MMKWLFDTKTLLIFIILIWLFSIFVIRIKYASIAEIFMNYFKCFRDQNGKVLFMPIFSYFLIPMLLAGVATCEKLVDTEIIGILTVIISILTAMLFTILTVVIEMKAKIKKDPNYYSIEAKVSEKSLIETYYAVMFEITMCVILLIVCLINAFINMLSTLQSFVIYSLSFIIICNLLIILKRIFKVIDTDMNK